MLKKLFVHEWKDTWRLVGIMNLIVLGLTLIGTFFLNNETWNAADKNEFLAVTIVVYMMFFITSVAVLSMVVMLSFFTRFYRNLYTDQGYLMHTLPVTAHQLIWSKTFVAVIWSFISTVVMITSIFSLVYSAIPSVDRDEFWMALRDFFAAAEFDGRFIGVIVLYVLLLVVAQFMSLFLGYASISIGQTFKKQKVLGAIGVYIGIYMLIQTVSSYLSMFMTMSVNSSTANDEITFLLISLVILLLVMAALAAGFYCITHYIMKNKLNLE